VNLCELEPHAGAFALPTGRQANAPYTYLIILIDSQDLFNKIDPPVAKKTISNPAGSIGKVGRGGFSLPI